MTVRFAQSGLLGLAIFVVASCSEMSGPQAPSQSFRNDYDAARGALEAGKYQRANRLYTGLLENAGPLEPRLRLEYAHSLLRNGDYGDAAQQARFVAQTQGSTMRSAALAVLGVAEHETGLIAVNAGNATAARLHFEIAQEALAEVLRNDPDLDPLGALAGRLSNLKLQLRAL
ncbi:hypothetical protein [Aestuariivita sp.]|jgi:hypothetical protein|uniref:hypothetical protein n=1 Tax=Aestuariivita sp. TaxID=1872407 RepID=UPI00216F312A|nr:hypothetical protein [Aestuariivita sp.]MCE8009870.1 hypothetical protein [Aestuariivita sp.]